MMINNTSTILLVSLSAKLRTLPFVTAVANYSLFTIHFSELLLYLDLREGLDDITHLDVVEVHQ